MSHNLRSGRNAKTSLLSNSWAKYLQSPSGMLISSEIFVRKRDIPRSPSLNLPVLPFKMFSGFISKWTISWLWSSSSPSKTSRIIFLRYSSEMRPCSLYSSDSVRSDGFLFYSLALYIFLNSYLASFLAYLSDFSHNSMTIWMRSSSIQLLKYLTIWGHSASTLSADRVCISCR